MAAELTPVERFETVDYSTGFRQPADPVWRVRVGEYCTDFETETAADNFRSAIIALLPQPSPGEYEGLIAEARGMASECRSGFPFTATMFDRLADALSSALRERDGLRDEMEMVREAEEGREPWSPEIIAEIDALEEKWDIDLCSTGIAGKHWRGYLKAEKDREVAVARAEAAERERDKIAAVNADWSAYDKGVREALTKIADGDVPRPVAHVFRHDGVASKHDTCAHEITMYNDCGECIAEFARSALSLVASEGEGNGS